MIFYILFFGNIITLFFTEKSELVTYSSLITPFSLTSFHSIHFISYYYSICQNQHGPCRGRPWRCFPLGPASQADGRPPLSKNLPSVEADGQQIAMLELGASKSWPAFTPLESTLANARGKTPGRAPLVLVGCIFRKKNKIDKSNSDSNYFERDIFSRSLFYATNLPDPRSTLKNIFRTPRIISHRLL